MSIKLAPDVQYRLMEHLAYSQTENYLDSLDNPNNEGAENFWLGIEEQLPFKFLLLDTKKYFNDMGDPIHRPFLKNKRAHFVACVKENYHGESKINVYGIYKFQGMRDIIIQKENKNIVWKVFIIPPEINTKLINKIKVRNGVCLIPTLNYDLLSEEDKKVREYYRMKIQKVPVQSPCCTIS